MEEICIAKKQNGESCKYKATKNSQYCGIHNKKNKSLEKEEDLKLEKKEDLKHQENIDLNSIICGDSSMVLKLFPNNFIDLTITSPPYDDLRKYQGYNFDFEVFKIIAKELFRITKEGGIVVWVVNDTTNNGSESGSSLKQALYFMECGFKLHDTMIYEKNGSSFPSSKDGKRYTQIFEYMFVFCKGKIKTGNLICDKPNNWAGYTNWGKQTRRNKNGDLVDKENIKPVPEFSPRNNIWKYNVGSGFSSKDKESHKHQAIFPDKLAEDHILSWSNEGDLVLDPFSGSGTTCKMAKKNKRNYIGVEMSKEYCELSESIISKY